VATGPRIVGIVQARLGSTRLPGKVLEDLAGEPMLVRVLQRLSRAETLSASLVATTTQRADVAIVELCLRRGWACFRGSEDDVLDRYYRAAREQNAEIVVRVTSDCPLIEPRVVDEVVRAFLEREGQVDYASTTWPRRTYPRGLDAEVISFAALERAWREDRNPAWREHVTPYVYRNPEKFRICSLESDVDYSQMRWTVDTAEDLELVRRIYGHFGHDRFDWREVLRLLEAHPDWLELNRHVQQKSVAPPSRGGVG
jgi:spore coat polysaccharide biosynthesis protein SpsF